MAPNQAQVADLLEEFGLNKIRVAMLGCGMKGQEHISYIACYDDLHLGYLCDPHEPSLEASLRVLKEFNPDHAATNPPMLLRNEQELLEHAKDIDLLVIATPNYLHTNTILEWGRHNLISLVEKPVAVSKEQVNLLRDFKAKPSFIARVWVAMEYRFIPAVAKLLSLLPSIGDPKMVTIRENRYPFLHKIGAWNRDPAKTGDTLVEKCCHFFDLFRLITGLEVMDRGVRAIAQRGVNYLDENGSTQDSELPIIDSAYVIMPFQNEKSVGTGVMGCLELCMYAEGSRHQEEIIVTGTEGRLEAYLPENKVYSFKRPNTNNWKDRSVPPLPESIMHEVYDCSDTKSVHGIAKDTHMPTHGGYHYSSTAIEWFQLLTAISRFKQTGIWAPQVSLDDGLRSVEIGMQATKVIANEMNIN